MASSSSSSHPRPRFRDPEFICDIKFDYDLPVPPVDYKLVNHPLDLSAMAEYYESSLEKDYKWSFPYDPWQSKLMDFSDLSIFDPKSDEHFDHSENENLLKSHDEFKELEKQLEKREFLMPSISYLEESVAQSSQNQQISQASIDDSIKEGKGGKYMDDHEDNREEKEHLQHESHSNTPSISPSKKENSLALPAIQSSLHLEKMEIKKPEDLDQIVKAGFGKPNLTTLKHPVNSNIHAINAWPLMPATFPNSPFEKEYIECSFDMINPPQDLPQKSILKTMTNPEKNTFTSNYYRKRIDDNELDNENDKTDQLYEYIRDYDMQKIEKPSTMVIFMEQDKNGHDHAYYAPINMVFNLKKKRIIGMSSAMNIDSGSGFPMSMGSNATNSEFSSSMDHVNYLVKRNE